MSLVGLGRVKTKSDLQFVAQLDHLAAQASVLSFDWIEGVQRSPWPLRNEVHVEFLNALRASILGAHLKGENLPLRLRKNAVTQSLG